MNIFIKKPIQNDSNKQLFSFDISVSGAKNFIFDTYENIYKKLKENKVNNFYEDNTFSNSIKLFIDIDDKIIFNTYLERDKYADIIIEKTIQEINTKLKEIISVKEIPIIILISDTLLKMSLHIIYPTLIFGNIYEMKYFMRDINIIDQSVYKIGCFRTLYSSKLGKNNKLVYYDSKNYKMEDDYKLFLDSSICNTDKISIKIDIPKL